MRRNFNLRLFLISLLALCLPILAAPIPENTASTTKRANSAHHGKMTWYQPGLGNCGQTDNEHDLIVALPTSVYSGGKQCNKHVKIHANGKTVTAKIRDRCPGCSAGDLDVSPAVFKKLSYLDKGVQSITWEIVP